MALSDQSSGERHFADAARDDSPTVAVVMSERAAAALAEACQIGKFRVEDWLESERGHNANPERRRRAEDAREWLDWGQRWLVDGTRVEVPDA